MSPSHLAARQEVTDLIDAIRLPEAAAEAAETSRVSPEPETG